MPEQDKFAELIQAGLEANGATAEHDNFAPALPSRLSTVNLSI